ncbi:MAG: hypothetical protein WCQ47_03885 [bacterium]
MLLIIFSIICSLSQGANNNTLKKLTQDQVEEIKNDTVFIDIVSQEMAKEEKNILRNKIVLNKTEKDLDLTIKYGLLEQEQCIRQSVSSLRAVAYVYNWVLEEIKNRQYDEVRLSMIQTLDRIRNLNKVFTDRTLKIEECKLQISTRNRNLKNEMINDRIDTKIDPIRVDVDIPEDYPAARYPFR